MSIEVYIDWDNETALVGRLYVAKASSSVSFQYASDWLTRKDAFAIDPTSLPLVSGTQHSKTLFGAIQDCGPDRWGRILIQRAVRKGIIPRKPYHDIDYVLELHDTSRIGALRFRIDPDGPFLAAGTDRLPPVVQLPALKRATDAIHTETETAKDLRFLLGQGSPVGGARPKAAVQLADGKLGIAKFPKPDDTRDIAGGEILGLELAQQAGVTVAEHEMIKLEGFSVSVITRFDRIDGARIPFLSGASLLTPQLGDLGSYTRLADAILQFGDDVITDLRQLWRRMVFSLLASNYDDHLRNHGFLMHAPNRWSLSPAYDINPVPEIDRSDINKMPIAEDGEGPSIASALEAAPRFRLKPDQAKEILREIFLVVSRWEETATRLRLGSKTLETYSTAFVQPMLSEAKRIVG